MEHSKINVFWYKKYQDFTKIDTKYHIKTQQTLYFIINQ